MTGGALHQRNRTCNFIWAAAQARPVALLLRFFSSAEESDVPPQWPARRARRTAIDTRGAHRKHEAPIGSGITCQRGLPVPRGRVRRDVLYEFGLCVAHVQHAKSSASRKTNLSAKYGS